MRAIRSAHRIYGSAVLILILNMSLLWAWRSRDYVMPKGWFTFVHGKPYTNFESRIESWRFGLITKRWERATSKVDLVGQWQSEDGEFFCEFREDGIFRCKGKPHRRWGVQAKLIDGLPYFLDIKGNYYIPRDRTGGTGQGLIAGSSFSLQQGDDDADDYCFGSIGTDGDPDRVHVMIDSIRHSIVYERLLLMRVQGLTFPDLESDR